MLLAMPRSKRARDPYRERKLAKLQALEVPREILECRCVTRKIKVLDGLLKQLGTIPDQTVRERHQVNRLTMERLSLKAVEDSPCEHMRAFIRTKWQEYGEHSLDELAAITDEWVEDLLLYSDADYRDRPTPDRFTDEWPGSLAKINVLAERAEKGQALKHPDDLDQLKLQKILLQAEHHPNGEDLRGEAEADE